MKKSNLLLHESVEQPGPSTSANLHDFIKTIEPSIYIEQMPRFI